MPSPYAEQPSGAAVPPTVPPELTSENWARVGRRLLAKMLGEFAYEEIIRPVPGVDPAPLPGHGTSPVQGFLPGGEHLAGHGTPTAHHGSPSGRMSFPHHGPVPPPRTDDDLHGDIAPPYLLPDRAERFAPFTLVLDAPTTHLTFHARRYAYDSWQVDPETITLTEAGAWPKPFGDPLSFLARARKTLGIDGATLGHVIRELTATLAADARLDHFALSAATLADLSYADLEGHQTGHPWLVLNKGRIGFSATDTKRWAPEARTPVTLPWLAVHQDLATYRGVSGLDGAADLYAAELGQQTRDTFAATLRARGVDPSGYLYLPVHPWQWDDIVLTLFAPAVAADAIIPLPTDGDQRLPQQSIRSFLNVTRPDRHTLKLPLSVLNTLVWRGLPTERTLAAPAVTAWMLGLRDSDPFLREECGVVLLGEVASVTVEHPVYDTLREVPYQYKELLGAIWREPLGRHLAPGERARTLAALLHTDPGGTAFTAELVARSGLPPHTWLRHLFAALLPPLLRFLYKYGTVFSPHGENAIVIFDERDVPVRLAVKDFVDDVNVSSEALPEHATMPDEVREVLLTEPPGYLIQFIHSGLFVGVFRYLALLCEQQLGVPEADFWSLVRAEIVRHQTRFPELKERYETFDLLTPEIARLCLNRNRLHLDGYRDRAERPHAAVHGTVPNPLSGT
ncbi:IucA/IucC family protein [Streptomyces uncialis]|uniref:IucA/IucC family protein n=1 Tax=Streptomyces uncialis TaxID=1048205 RepID=UPI0036634958